MPKSPIQDSYNTKQLMRFTRIITLFVFFFATPGTYALAQTAEIDRIQKLLQSDVKGQARIDLLTALAYENFDVNDSLALIYSQQALEASIEEKYPPGEKYANTLIGLGLLSTGKHAKAIPYFLQSDQISEPKRMDISAHNDLVHGMALGEMGEYDSALHYYSKARLIAGKGAPEYLPTVYMNIAWTCLQKWRNHEAISYLDSARAEITDEDDYLQMELFNLYCKAYLNLLDFDKAESYANKLCTLANKGNDYFHKIECQLDKSRLQLTKGEYNSALIASLEAVSLSKKYNYYQYVEILHQAGDVYLEISQLELTAKYLYQALQLSEAAGLKHKTGAIYNSLAWLAKTQRKFDLAIDYTNRAESLLEEVGDPIGVSESYNVKGLTYALMKDYRKAEQLYRKSLQIRKEIDHPRGVASSLYNLADIYLEWNRTNEALILLNKVVVIEEKIGNKPNLSMTYGLIARQLTRDKKFAEALSFLKRAEKMGEEDQSLFIKRDNALSYSFFYLEQNDYKTAYHYQREYQNLNDKIYNSKGADRLAEYEALYKVQKREQEVKLLNEEHQNHEERIALQQLKLVQKNTIIISGAIIILLFGFMTWRGLLHNRKLILLNHEILKRKEEVERASTAKSEFLSNISHEIRTPLNGIIGFADLMAKTSLTPSQVKHLSIISQSGGSLLRIIDDILDFSKIEAGKIVLSRDKVSLIPLCNQVIDMLSQEATRKGLQLSFFHSPDIPLLILADELRLRQVLTNLLANAVKFTSQGKVELKINKLESNSAATSRIHFSVSDTGIGIDPKNQQKVFEAFIQEDISNTKKYGGTGLGLSISNKLLALMGSRLELESEKGKGSLFHFTIECSVLS